MEKPFITRWAINSFPTASPGMAVYAQSHNACYCEYLSFPIPSPKKKKSIKKSGAHPPDKPKVALPLYFESVDYSIFPTAQTEEILMKYCPYCKNHSQRPIRSFLSPYPHAFLTARKDSADR